MRAFLVSALGLILAAALQAALGEQFAIGWARPDFILTVAAVLAVHRTSDGASLTGFFAGLLQGGVMNSHMAAFVISRTLGCLSAERISAAFVGRTYVTVGVACMVASILSAVLYLFVGVPGTIVGWLLAMAGGAVYNSILAALLYSAYRAIIRPANP
ncbi:MAG: hypothetical protein H0W86_07635 [Armatimonadetes bacterium]|nr:hypothetical protein [Armatimonadota bacterium]